MASRSRSPAALQSGSDLKKQTSLLIPANPAYEDPGSSPVSRGGILLNPLSPEEIASANKTKKKSIHHKSSNASNASSSSLGSSSTSGTSPTSSAASSLPGSSNSESPRLKFAPLPSSGKKRSNSIALGVSARAQMLAGQGQVPQQQVQQQRPQQPQPCWQDNVAQVKPMWYNGGPLPDNVKTVHDLKPGMKKLFGKLRRRSSTSSSGQRSESADSNASSTSESVDLASQATAQNGSALGLSQLDSGLSRTESIPEADEEGHMAEEEGERGRPLLRDGFASVESGEQTPRRRASPTHHHQNMNDHTAMQTSQSALMHHHLHLSGHSQPGSGASTPRRRMSMTDMQDSNYLDRHTRHNQAVFGYDETQLAGKFNDLGLHRFASPTSPTQESESALDTSSSIGEEDESMEEDRSNVGEGEDDEEVPLPTDSAQAKAGQREVVHGHKQQGPA